MNRLDRTAARRGVLAGLVLLAALGASAPALAQGCVAVKMDVPVLGAQDHYEGDKPWQVSIGYRWFRSDRHFVGTDEQNYRQDEGSEVINDVHLIDFGLHYDVDPRWTVSLGVPLQMADRSNPIRDENDVVIGRAVTNARGLGDLLVTARRWMYDPAKAQRGNIKLGFGLKLPTGANNLTDIRTRYDETTQEFYPSVEHVDQSIMPGDGGFGFVLDLQSYRRFAGQHAAFYASATYIVQPDGDNGVTRGSSGTSTNSITDFYVARTGVLWAPGAGRYGWSLGGRIEGVPWDDLIGSNEGFRRPGYVVSAEPGFSWGRGPHAVTFAAPIAVIRDRIWSESDRARGRGGDAAFADYSLIATYIRRF